MFTPQTGGEYVDYTVNLRHIARTTTETLRKHHTEVERLPGQNLLDIDDNIVPLTEFIDHQQVGDMEDHPVLAEGLDGATDEYFGYVTGIYDGSKINYDYESGKFETIRGEGTELAELRPTIETHFDREINLGSADRTEYDPKAEDRSRQLGYLS